MCNIYFGIYTILITVFLPVKAQYTITPSGSYAIKNKEFNITCNIGPSFTVPAFGIIWRRNGVNVVVIQSSNCQTYVGSGGQALYQRYTYNCTSNRSYNLYISATQINNEDGSDWRCENNDPSLGSSINYTVIVYDRPTADPVILGYSGTTTYLGDTITLTCSLNGGNPLAALIWTCKGVTVQGVNANTQTSAINRYTVTIDTSYNGQRCTCTASHQLWSDGKVVQSQPFVVHYPPTGNPIIIGYNGTFRYNDDNITLTCTVSGGSPQATLSWTCNGQQQTSIGQSTSGTLVTSNVRVTMTKELNGKTCICHGRHSDIRYSPNITSRSFVVYYPPSYPLVDVSSDTPFPWIEGGNGKLRCSVNDGNPPVSYEWLDPAGVISGQSLYMLPLSSLTKDDNRKGYRCKVSNAYTIAKNMNLISQPKQLDVEYNPVVSVGTSPAYVRETDTFQRLCRADGNPPQTLTWTSNTDPSNAVTLRLVNIMRNQTGDYTCRAQARSNGQHGILSGQAVLNVIVQFPPTVEAIFDKTSLIEGQTVTMYCLARGEPDHYTYGGWVQEYKNTVVRFVNDLQNFTISRLTHQDIGIYRCRAHNSITDVNGLLFQQGTKDLKIKFSAVFNSSKTFYTELNKTVEIKIPFFANPLLQNKDTITLTKQNINQKERTDIQVNIGTTTLGIVFHGQNINVEGQQVIIHMFQFKNELQGNYTIGIKNYDQGPISSFVFEVALSGPPEHPKDFEVLTSTSDSVTVTWRAGNNGGHQQIFVICYQETGKDETLKTQNVTENGRKLSYIFTISELNPDTEYTVWIYAKNTKGNSEMEIESKNMVSITTKQLKMSQTNCDISKWITIGVAVGVLVGILGEGLVVSFLLWRKRILNENASDGNEQKQYEETKNPQEDANVYDGINQLDEDVQNSRESLSNIEEYEDLHQRPASSAYQELHHKGDEAIEMSSVYVNTTVK